MNKSNSISNIQYPMFNLQVGAALLAAVLAVSAPAAEPAGRNLTLADCVGLALENNLDLRIERISRTVAQQDVAAARGGYDPNLTLSANPRVPTPARPPARWQCPARTRTTTRSRPTLPARRRWAG